MSRVSSVLYLSPEQQATVERVIRHHRYARLDAMRSSLQEQGIEISRSALHRFTLTLKAADGGLMAGATVVTVVERGSGRTTSVATDASGPAVLALLASMQQK